MLSKNCDEEILELEEKVLSLKKDNLHLKFKIREQEASEVSSEEIYNLKVEVEALTQEKSNIKHLRPLQKSMYPFPLHL